MGQPGDGTARWWDSQVMRQPGDETARCWDSQVMGQLDDGTARWWDSQVMGQPGDGTARWWDRPDDMGCYYHSAQNDTTTTFNIHTLSHQVFDTTYKYRLIFTIISLPLSVQWNPRYRHQLAQQTYARSSYWALDSCIGAARSSYWAHDSCIGAVVWTTPLLHLIQSARVIGRLTHVLGLHARVIGRMTHVLGL